jgi:hypothetical protein
MRNYSSPHWKERSLFSLQQDVCALCGSEAPIYIVDNGGKMWQDMGFFYLHVNQCKNKECGYSAEISYFPKGIM